MKISVTPVEAYATPEPAALITGPPRCEAVLSHESEHRTLTGRDAEKTARPAADAGALALDLPWSSLFMQAEQSQEGLLWRLQLGIKRMIDLVGGTLLLILLAPVLAGAAMAVWLSSPGPVFFRQKRWGRSEGLFDCFKFRSMYVDQDKYVDQSAVAAMARNGILMKHARDSRVTAVGSFLRKTSIDELPQLFNVIKGEMSLVGPRPLVLHMLEPYPELRRLRGLMRPGITGVWQVSDRASNNSVLQMVRYDIHYILGFSLWLDFKTVLKTPVVVIWGDGAH